MITTVFYGVMFPCQEGADKSPRVNGEDDWAYALERAGHAVGSPRTGAGDWSWGNLSVEASERKGCDGAAVDLADLVVDPEWDGIIAAALAAIEWVDYEGNPTEPPPLNIGWYAVGAYW